MEDFDVIISRAIIFSSSGTQQADIGMRREQIEAIGDLAGASSARKVDANGLAVFPGAIDTQVHFREPGLEHKEDIASGTLAAIFGGVTCIFEMPNTNPMTTSAEALADKLNRANGRAHCDYSFFIGATTDNIDSLAQFELLPGSPGIKMFAGSSTGNLLVDSLAYQKLVLEHGTHPMPIHSELESRLRDRKNLFGDHPHVRVHPEIRDAEAAIQSTRNLISLCEQTRRPIHILHVSTADELALIREAKNNGLPVTCEVTPHHLTLNSQDYETLGTLIQMNPPVREESHRVALWQAVREGLFDVFGSDHAPHTLDEKSKPYPESPSGMPGVQTLFPILLDWALKGEFEINQLVAMLMEHPADVYGIQKKGYLQTGFDADFILVDLETKWTVTHDSMKSKCGWTPYAGRELQGKIKSVWLRGNEIVHEGELINPALGKPARFNWK